MTTTSNSPRPNVLVVDDDRELREIVSDVLEGEGLVTATATDGEEALASLRSRPEQLPDVILLDLSMPVMDGVAFREEQLRDSQLAEIPVVVFSASAAVGERVNHLNVAGILKKPIRLDKLLETVKRFCA